MSTAFVHSNRLARLVLTLTCFLSATVFPSPGLFAQQAKTPPPQASDRFAYARANPLLDANSSVTYQCADSELCDSPEDGAFELARQNDLKSGDPAVVRAVRAYSRGVTVEFGDPGPGMQSATHHQVRGDASAANGLRAIETVIFRLDLPAVQLQAAVGHEGSHVADAQDFVNAITRTGEIDQSKNLSTYETEFRAYLVTHSILASDKVRIGYGECGKDTACHLGFGVGREQAIQTINRLLANPANRCGPAPHYGLTPDSPGPALYEGLTPPYLVPQETGQSGAHR